MPKTAFVLMKKFMLLATLIVSFCCAWGYVAEIEGVLPGNYGSESIPRLKSEWRTNPLYRYATYYMYASATTVALSLLLWSFRRDKKSRESNI